MKDQVRLWLYVLACLAVPPIWAVLMYFAFEVWERRQRPATARAELPPIDYSI